MNDQSNNWEYLLPAIVFSMNASVNSTSGYSPHEIVYGHRPRFPLSGVSIDMKTLPKDIHGYLQNLQRTLATIYEDMLTHIQASQTKMMDTVNAKSRPISFTTGDYVYLQSTPVGTGQKLQELFKGPFVVKATVSTHLIKLFDPSTQKTLDKPVHVNRLKHAYIRAPTPENYFQITRSVYRDQAVQTFDLNQEDDETSHPQVMSDDSVQSDHMTRTQETHSESAVQSESSVPPTVDPDPHPVPGVSTRPRRTIRKPLRYQDRSVDLGDISSSDHCSPTILYKIKRILPKRGSGHDVEYLVHFIGEPSQLKSYMG